MIIKGDIIIYSHALVIEDYIATLVIVNPENTKTSEERIKAFLEQNLFDEKLFACTHYNKYKSLNPIIYQDLNKRNIATFPKLVRNSFYKSHYSAKQACYDALKRL